MWKNIFFVHFLLYSLDRQQTLVILIKNSVYVWALHYIEGYLRHIVIKTLITEQSEMCQKLSDNIFSCNNRTSVQDTGEKKTFVWLSAVQIGTNFKHLLSYSLLQSMLLYCSEF